MQISKKLRCLESAQKILAYKVVLLFIWWSKTTEGFIDSHFEVKDSNVFFRFYGVDYITTPWSCTSTGILNFRSDVNYSLT